MQEQITKLKKRRDDLLNRACSRQELPEIMKEVRALSREIQTLEEKKQAT
jgi:hypothetical protein